MNPPLHSLQATSAQQQATELSQQLQQTRTLLEQSEMQEAELREQAAGLQQQLQQAQAFLASSQKGAAVLSQQLEAALQHKQQTRKEGQVGADDLKPFGFQSEHGAFVLQCVTLVQGQVVGRRHWREMTVGPGIRLMHCAGKMNTLNVYITVIQLCYLSLLERTERQKGSR